ncbi:hypothetical protein [Nonomuraea sp. NPDC046570]|uniref:hypothetical protein n=1 Tax=Nonomuraea sp. NPDC046570 TaxID=3155255 RepID=UPI0033FFB3C8
MTTRHLTPIIGPTGLPTAAARADYLRWFQQQEWIGDAAAVLYGLGREHQPKPEANRGHRPAHHRQMTAA